MYVVNGTLLKTLGGIFNGGIIRRVIPSWTGVVQDGVVNILKTTIKVSL